MLRVDKKKLIFSCILIIYIPHFGETGHRFDSSGLYRIHAKTIEMILVLPSDLTFSPYQHRVDGSVLSMTQDQKLVDNFLPFDLPVTLATRKFAPSNYLHSQFFPTYSASKEHIFDSSSFFLLPRMNILIPPNIVEEISMKTQQEHLDEQEIEGRKTERIVKIEINSTRDKLEQ